MHFKPKQKEEVEKRIELPISKLYWINSAANYKNGERTYIGYIHFNSKYKITNFSEGGYKLGTYYAYFEGKCVNTVLANKKSAIKWCENHHLARSQREIRYFVEDETFLKIDFV